MSNTQQEDFRYFRIPNVPVERVRAFDGNGIAYSTEEININELKSIWEQAERERIIKEMEPLQYIIKDIASYSNADGGGEIITLCEQASKILNLLQTNDK
jgi:hypothetical protein